jgi:endonuclease/exonuclease/phosphatase family metal-dependent hydrolase
VDRFKPSTPFHPSDQFLMTRVSRHRILLLTFTFLIAVTSLPGQSIPQTIRMMSFNIRYDEPRDGVNAWSNRKQKVADVIRFHKADLVGVQEALLTQLRDLESMLPDMAWCGVGRTDGKEAGEYSAILYRKSQFQVHECKTFWLSPTPETAGSKGWDAAFPRVVTWAKFRNRETKKTFIHFNTHFDHVGQTARVESSKLILQKIAQVAGKLPFVLTGDFNVVESNEAYKTIVTGTEAVKLSDAKYVTANPHFGGDSTWTAFKQIEPGRRIDYVFVQAGMRVFEHGILADQWNGLWASDHFPVLAEIEVK